MYISAISALAVAGYAGLAAAETIIIESGNTYFQPSSVNASVGDVLEFHFLPNNHSVVMGNFSSPCEPASTGGFYSGFLPSSKGENPQVFRVTINDTDPFVFYCSQNASSHNHCKTGMYGFVNQQNQTVIDTYSAAANDSSINISPDSEVYGGVLAASNSTTSSNSTATTGTATATQSSSSTGTSSGSSSTSSSSETPTDNSGAGVKASGLFAIAMALILV